MLRPGQILVVIEVGAIGRAVQNVLKRRAGLRKVRPVNVRLYIRNPLVFDGVDDRRSTRRCADQGCPDSEDLARANAGVLQVKPCRCAGVDVIDASNLRREVVCCRVGSMNHTFDRHERRVGNRSNLQRFVFVRCRFENHIVTNRKRGVERCTRADDPIVASDNRDRASRIRRVLEHQFFATERTNHIGDTKEFVILRLHRDRTGSNVEACRINLELQVFVLICGPSCRVGGREQSAARNIRDDSATRDQVVFASLSNPHAIVGIVRDRDDDNRIFGVGLQCDRSLEHNIGCDARICRDENA
ncbi:hypothetical protein SmphiM12_130 [Sinorhizobium phage phiM12]|uniref:Uncharacterized protein n=1 Tax=Sinorhizobium phage phiM12 TaxID=1357423 RepID=S5MV57_9CAUD|nr:hypothetical protein AB690_gp101 [Sinorhizobium phage phiM12]AGR47762.1 hypothetical protein SmphiM12_130 [Sinorhizobium phage phiM12]